MNEEIKDIVEILELVKEELENNDENTSAILDLQDLKSLKKLYDLYTEAEKERDGIYDDYQDLGKENLKLQEELEQERNKINTIKKLMSVGDITDEALFTLVQTTMAELDRLEDIEEKLDKEKEKNKKLMQEYHKRVQEKLDLMYVGGAKSETEVKRDYVPKDKIREKIEEIEKEIEIEGLSEKDNDLIYTPYALYKYAQNNLKELLEGK